MAKPSSNLNLIKKIIELIKEDNIDSALTQFRKLLDFKGKFTQEEIEEIYAFGRLFESEKIKAQYDLFLFELDKKIYKKEHENLYFIKSEIIFYDEDRRGMLLFLNEAIIKYPKNAELLNNRAILLKFLNRPENAIKDINKALKLNYNKPTYLDTRALILQELTFFDDALNDINKAIEIDPNELEYLDTRALILQDLNCFDDALNDINKAIEIDPNEPKYLNTRALIFQTLDRHEDALIDVTKALRMEFNPIGLHNRAQILIHLKRNEEALKDIEKIYRIKKDSESLANIISALINLKKLDVARKELLNGFKQYRKSEDYDVLSQVNTMLNQAELSEKIDKKYTDLDKKLEKTQNQLEENKIKIIEFLGIFAGIITFVLSGVSIMGNGGHSLYENLILMLGLALSLVLFVLLIDLVSTSKFSITDENLRKKLTHFKIILAVIVIILFAVLLVFANKI